MADVSSDYIATNTAFASDGNNSANAATSSDPKNVQDLTNYVQLILQQMQDKFQEMSDKITGRMDEMAKRIDDLEKNIATIMTDAGLDNIE
ncbi:heat shock factor-binding protein 1-like [Octopus bimaculoides]|uniref:Heat shock factor-binding protein 1 n=1 Tax=Octopus sinensis TaxID=2607531 RepID=A0A6P7T9C4_9MOLL|nr:heat shock factor-binding protein 1-like [Octopus bimaculoides]XP_029647543.1 heat shock factor-binding protein 1 [Octopus sinensis]|eukprot:XP_014770348.1 PREDICTED: heat shock factor-binding protein 1-like [Octopus bimaculoides]